MHTVNNTPAENLLQRLLLSKKLDETYQCSIERAENHTSIYLHMVAFENGHRLLVAKH